MRVPYATCINTHMRMHVNHSLIYIATCAQHTMFTSSFLLLFFSGFGPRFLFSGATAKKVLYNDAALILQAGNCVSWHSSLPNAF